MSREKWPVRAAVFSAGQRDRCRMEEGAALSGALSGELVHDGAVQWVGGHLHVIDGLAQRHKSLLGIAGILDVDHFF